MYKLGEIWVNDGNGCLGFVMLIIVLGMIALPIMGGIWLWNAGSNFVNYRTIDAETAHVRATATAVVLRTQAVATAMAPIEADPSYYAHIAEKARITIGAVSNLGYDPNYDHADGAIYFNLNLENGDSKLHTIHLSFLASNGYRFARDIRLSPGSVSLKIVEPPTPSLSVRFAGGTVFGGMSLDPKDLQVRLELIDGFPLRDPREILSKFEVQLSKFQYQPVYANERNDVVLRVVVTNTDNLPHTITGHADYTYTYKYLGDPKSEKGKLNSYGEVVCPPGKSIAIGEISPLRLNDADRVLVNQVVVELADPETESVPSSVKTKTFTSATWNYKR